MKLYECQRSSSFVNLAKGHSDFKIKYCFFFFSKTVGTFKTKVYTNDLGLMAKYGHIICRTEISLSENMIVTNSFDTVFY